MAQERPLIGLGVIIENEKGEVLIGKRIGSHAQFNSIPGGALEVGETFELGAAREVREETGLSVPVQALGIIAVTNNLETYQAEGFHSVSVVMHTRQFSGEPRVMEPKKCERWFWCDPRKVPEPHFDASRLAIECFLNNSFYKGITS